MSRWFVVKVSPDMPSLRTCAWRRDGGLEAAESAWARARGSGDLGLVRVEKKLEEQPLAWRTIAAALMT
jgi:hypothetical protein